jgi:hypothetical protein
VAIVTLPSLGSSSRRIWLRLVFMRAARRLRERFRAFIAAASCRASTSLMAAASNASRFSFFLQDVIQHAMLGSSLPARACRRSIRSQKLSDAADSGQAALQIRQ